MKKTIISRIFITALVALCAMGADATSVQQLLASLKARVAPDARTAVWDVSVTEQDQVPVIVGTVGTIAQRELISRELSDSSVTIFDNRVVALEQTVPMQKRNAMVKLSVATLRTQPKHSAEIATQAVMGTPVKVLCEDGEWLRVQLPDTYIAYVPESSVAYMSTAEMSQWKVAKRFIVTDYCSRLVAQPGGDETVTDLVLGCILQYVSEKGKWLCLATPDGREGWVEKTVVAEFSKWAQQDLNIALIESTARRMMGSGYLWGGTSTKVTDCSGLMKVSYFASGIILQRDASQQALTGEKIPDWHSAVRGDLLFFGNSRTGRVTHVGMYLADGLYIHCSGQVKINSLDPESPLYLYSPLSISRIQGQVGTTGITAVRNHAWYF